MNSNTLLIEMKRIRITVFFIVNVITIKKAPNLANLFSLKFNKNNSKVCATETCGHSMQQDG